MILNYVSLAAVSLDSCLLGTHDIQNVSVTSHSPGELQVIGHFINGSNAIGVFVVIYSLNVELDVYYRLFIRDQQKVTASVAGLPGGQYRISIFVVENGLPLERAATEPKLVVVENATDSKYNIACI